MLHIVESRCKSRVYKYVLPFALALRIFTDVRTDMQHLRKQELGSDHSSQVHVFLTVLDDAPKDSVKNVYLSQIEKVEDASAVKLTKPTLWSLPLINLSLAFGTFRIEL